MRRSRPVPARLRSVLAVLLAAAFVAPASFATASAAPVRSPNPPAATGRPLPLPPHSQRPVCGTPRAGSARCHAHVVTHPDSARPLATSSYQDGYTPAQLQSAYSLPGVSGGPGTGPTVAVVDAYDNPNAEADLNAYRSGFGLGQCSAGNGCFAKVDQSGGTHYPRGDTNWGAEIDLDIEMVSATCPSCKVLLVEAKSNRFSDLMAAVDYAVAHADFVSNSYGGSEFSGESSYDHHFDPNKPITVSSGDNGYGVEYPAASPNVTAVGGTSLTGSTTSGWNETAWSGAGSGCSAYESKPSWQTDGGCAGRTVTDVSAVADPNTGVAVYDSYGSRGGANWYVYGGTSVAAPLVAGVWALAGTSAVSSPAPKTPYDNGTGWNDVTQGSNASQCGDGYLCEAVIGYDGPTGLGTPNGTSGFAATSTGGTGGGTTSGPTAAFTYTCTGLVCDFTDQSTDPDSTATIQQWNWHFGDQTEATTQNPSHEFTAAGTYTVDLFVTDDAGNVGTTSKDVTVSVLTLTARGYKDKGRNTVDLSWKGATATVDVYRDRSKIDTVTGTAYTDATGDRGGATYSYRVCDTGATTTCSQTVTVTF